MNKDHVALMLKDGKSVKVTPIKCLSKEQQNAIEQLRERHANKKVSISPFDKIREQIDKVKEKLSRAFGHTSFGKLKWPFHRKDIQRN